MLRTLLWLAPAVLAAILLSNQHDMAAGSDAVDDVAGQVFIVTSVVARSSAGVQTGTSVSLRLEVDGVFVSVNLLPGAQVVDESGAEIAPTTLRPGDWVHAFGVRESETVLLADRVERVVG